MADLIIPAALRTWLIFLIAFVVLGYSARFSILFGAIAGIAGGMITAWWQVKGGAPTKESKDHNAVPVPEGSKPARADGQSLGERWRLPFVKPTPARSRYQERMRRARARREEKRPSSRS